MKYIHVARKKNTDRFLPRFCSSSQSGSLVVETDRSVTSTLPFILLRHVVPRERRNGEEEQERSRKRGWRGGARSRKTRQKRPAQNSERNVILNDNKAKVIIV